PAARPPAPPSGCPPARRSFDGSVPLTAPHAKPAAATARDLAGKQSRVETEPTLLQVGVRSDEGRRPLTRSRRRRADLRGLPGHRRGDTPLLSRAHTSVQLIVVSSLASAEQTSL